MAADSVLDQADALMRRHRSFVARSEDEAVVHAEAEAEIPLLTDVVDANALPAQDLDTIIAALGTEIDEAISAWLVDVLPAAVANASQQILAELDAKARHTLLPRLQEILAAHAGQERPGSVQGEDDPSV